MLTPMTAFGAAAVTVMLVAYALERRGPRVGAPVRRRVRGIVAVRLDLRRLAVRGRGSGLGGGSGTPLAPGGDRTALARGVTIVGVRKRAALS